MYGTYQKNFMWFESSGSPAHNDVEVGTGDKYYIEIPIPMTIVGFGLVVTDEVVNYDNASPTEAVWALDYRPINDSDGSGATARVELETITIPSNKALTSLAIGEVLYNKMAACKGGYDVDPGGQLVLEVKTAGLGSTETGELMAFVVWHDRGEYIDNLDNDVTIVEE